jgi:hypothetical protein
MPDSMSRLRRNLSRHGISWSPGEARRQVSHLPRVEPKDAHIDHVHDQCKSHDREFGCVACVRGALHSFCNRSLVFAFDKWAHLQTDAIKSYLKGRPLLGK